MPDELISGFHLAPLILELRDRQLSSPAASLSSFSERHPDNFQTDTSQSSFELAAPWQLLTKRCTGTVDNADFSIHIFTPRSGDRGRYVAKTAPAQIMVSTCEITDEVTFNAAITRPRAIVLVSPPWSVYSIRARTVFADAAEQLIANGTCTNDDFFVLIDDDPANKNPFWLWLGLPNDTRPPLTNSVATGAGSVIWLRDGQIVHYEFSASHIGVNGLVDKTMEIRA